MINGVADHMHKRTFEALKGKAVAKGIISEDTARNMPDRDAFRLVFNAGLSTAKVVTDVSGRGVGMDVVMSNVTKMGGQILIDSVKGKGSVFTITLPMTVTLAVIDGLVARIGEEHYIVPLSEVRESVQPTASQLHTIKGSANEVLNMRGVLYPLVRLNRLLGVQGSTIDDPAQATIILVEGKRGGHAAFMVDELVGQQSIVVKDLGKQFEKLMTIQGASILGDARVGLVLDVNGILCMTGAQTGES
jgi:two-component system chemotaxis sensor kinase CheA